MTYVGWAGPQHPSHRQTETDRPIYKAYTLFMHGGAHKKHRALMEDVGYSDSLLK